MRRAYSCIIAMVLILGCGVAVAGGLRVSGEVSGIWTTGTTVFVEGQVWVPRDAELQIDSGVVVIFQTTAPFLIYGSFNAGGTEGEPIILYAPNGWSGFHFEGLNYEERVLKWMRIDERSGLPDSVIVSSESFLTLLNCDFRGSRSCVYAHGGRFRADGNRFRTTGFLSKTVYLNELSNNILDGNRFCNNFVTAAVPERPGPFPVYLATVGLEINGFHQLRLTGNVITVIGPGDVIGVHFDRSCSGGIADLWTMSDCVVTVRSYNQQPCGVFNSNEGTLWIIQCTIDVARALASNPYYSTGVVASQSARVTVNSSAVQVDVGTLNFQSRSSGWVEVDYVVYWRNSGWFTPPSTPDPGSFDRMSFSDEDSIHYGAHAYLADPLFLSHGEWGTWRTLSEVAAYYGLQGGSPCIDSADVVRCPNDPDGTLPDIGCFYYDPPDAAAPVYAALPDDVQLLAPYPNPFNAATVIPFELSRNGWVRVRAFNALGQEVAVMANGSFSIGRHEVWWDATSMASGQYFVTVEMNGLRTGVRAIQLVK
ncbi:MAG: T9SS type A sorting domain-containing protein [bacterium]|nr:T9SS type A sorting domain-containing protein [bacterium]